MLQKCGVDVDAEKVLLKAAEAAKVKLKRFNSKTLLCLKVKQLTFTESKKRKKYIETLQKWFKKAEKSSK